MSCVVDKAYHFAHPFTAIVAGVTQSGKTEFVKKLIRNKNKMIYPVPYKIIFSYSEAQEGYSNVFNDPDVESVKGLEFDLDESLPTLLIIDDQMTAAMKDGKIQELFIKGVHHRNVSVILLNQNLYCQGKYGRDIRLNSHYYIIMKSPSLVSQVNYLGHQVFPSKKKFLSEAYKIATKHPYSYLFLNLHPTCEDTLRVRSNIFPTESEIIYLLA